jgi:hypothetical protein
MRTGRYYLFPPTFVSFCQKITHPVRISMSDLGRVKPEARYCDYGLARCSSRAFAHVGDHKFLEKNSKKMSQRSRTTLFYPVKITAKAFSKAAQHKKATRQKQLNRPQKATELRHDCSADKTEASDVLSQSQIS